MKTYVIILSKVFPKVHSQAGHSTYFYDKFLLGQNCIGCKEKETDCVFCYGELPKLHTIRANYSLWKARFEEISVGKARLSIRQWTGKPYRSKQEEIASLTASDGIGIQMLSFAPYYTLTVPFVDSRRITLDVLAANDGLTNADWREWFMHNDLTHPLAIIHFTKFRY
jgi:hypothetical protein